jgi:hypothetical protein
MDKLDRSMPVNNREVVAPLFAFCIFAGQPQRPLFKKTSI